MSFGGILRQSTAVDVLIGPFVDSADGDTEKGALTIAQADVRLSKNGQTGAQKNDNTTCAHDADGFYNCELDATDTNTVGQLALWVHVAGALAVRHDYQVIEEAIYDALYEASANAFSGAAGSTTLTALASGSITAAVIATGAIDADAIADNAIDAGAIASDAITAAKIASAAITAAKFGAGAIDAAAIADGAIDAATFAAGAINAAAIANAAIDAATFAADVDAEILSYLVDDATRIDASALNTLSGHDPGETIMGATDLGTGAGLTSLASAANLATLTTRVGTPSDLGGGATVAANLADIEAQTDDIGAAGAGLTALASAANLAVVDGIVDDILVDTSTTLQGELDGIQADTENIQSRLPAALVSGRMDANTQADFSGAVVDDAGNSGSTFLTDRTETADDHWLGAYLRFTSGDLLGQVRKVTAYDGTTKFVTVTPAFTAEPPAGDDFDLVNE